MPVPTSAEPGAVVGTSPSAPRPGRAPFAAGGVPPAPRHARRQQRSARDPLTPPPSVLRSRCVTPVTSRPPLATRPLRQPWCAPGPDRIRRYRRPVTPRRVTSAPSSALLTIRAPCRHRSPVRTVLRSPPAPFRPRRARPVASSATPAARPRRIPTGAAVEDRPAVDACPEAGSDTRRPNLRRWCVIRSPTTAIRGSDYPRWRRRCSPNIPK